MPFLAGSSLKLLRMLSCCPCGLSTLSAMSSSVPFNSDFFSWVSGDSDQNILCYVFCEKLTGLHGT